MATPNDRRATKSGTFSAATRRAVPIFRLPVFSVALVGSLLDAPSVLVKRKIAYGSDELNSAN